MCSSLVVALGLLTVAAPPQAPRPYQQSARNVRAVATQAPNVADVPMAEPVPPGEVAETQSVLSQEAGAFPYGFSGPSGMGHCNGNTCSSGDGISGLPCCFDSTCNLFPHVPYYVEPKTYYYFRPYNHNHIFVQQNQVMRWGGDPRHPYANEIFQQVYRDLDGQAAEPGVPSAAPITPNAAPITPGDVPGNVPGEAPPRGAQMPSNIQISATEAEETAPLAERMVRFLDDAAKK
jgi:hypothetical protein